MPHPNCRRPTRRIILASGLRHDATNCLGLAFSRAPSLRGLRNRGGYTMRLGTCVLYAQVSVRQEERGVVEKQIAVVDAYAAAHGLIIAQGHHYIDDGYGDRLDRPSLEGLRDTARRGELDSVFILAPDHLSRRYVDLCMALEESDRIGCAVVFVTGLFAARSEGRQVCEIHGLVAEFERAALQKHGHRSKPRPARQRAFFTGVGPYGYTFCQRATSSAAAAWSMRRRSPSSAGCSPGCPRRGYPRRP